MMSVGDKCESKQHNGSKWIWPDPPVIGTIVKRNEYLYWVEFPDGTVEHSMHSHYRPVRESR